MTACEGLIPSDCNNPDCPAHAADRDDLDAINRNHADGTPRRLAACAQANPANDDYHPGCCRFPKSCSPYPYAETPVTNADLEPYRADRVDAEDTDNTTDRT